MLHVEYPSPLPLQMRSPLSKPNRYEGCPSPNPSLSRSLGITGRTRYEGSVPTTINAASFGLLHSKSDLNNYEIAGYSTPENMRPASPAYTLPYGSNASPIPYSAAMQSLSARSERYRTASPILMRPNNFAGTPGTMSSFKSPNDSSILSSGNGLAQMFTPRKASPSPSSRSFPESCTCRRSSSVPRLKSSVPMATYNSCYLTEPRKPTILFRDEDHLHLHSPMKSSSSQQPKSIPHALVDDMFELPSRNQAPISQGNFSSAGQNMEKLVADAMSAIGSLKQSPTQQSALLAASRVDALLEMIRPLLQCWVEHVLYLAGEGSARQLAPGSEQVEALSTLKAVLDRLNNLLGTATPKDIPALGSPTPYTPSPPSTVPVSPVLLPNPNPESPFTPVAQRPEPTRPEPETPTVSQLAHSSRRLLGGLRNASNDLAQLKEGLKRLSQGLGKQNIELEPQAAT